MIDRYTRPEMGRLWSEEARLARWLEIELALVDVLAERGEVPPAAARSLRAGARIDPARMRAIEEEVKHDVIAFVTAGAGKGGGEGPHPPPRPPPGGGGRPALPMPLPAA